MKLGTLNIDSPEGKYEVDITKADIKALKNIMADIESEYCRKLMSGVREAQEKDKRLKTIYKLLNL
jgi:hypothetical protein